MTNNPYQSIPALKSFDGFNFPIKNGTYEIAPGLKKIKDDQIFIKNNSYQTYLDEKQKCNAEDPNKYYAIYPGFDEEIDVVCKFLGTGSFHDNCMRLQEDIAIVKDGFNIALHLSFPNHWNPITKLGQSFIETHDPVADFDHINNISNSIIEACIHKGPYQRYAWGLSSDTRLNHHPLPPEGISYEDWAGRKNQEEMYMRVERQAIKGFPEIDCFLFTIFTFFVHLKDLTTEQYDSLESAIDSMTEDTLYYKGINKEEFNSYRKEYYERSKN